MSKEIDLEANYNAQAGTQDNWRQFLIKNN